MKQYIAILFIILYFNPSFGQKEIEANKNTVVQRFIQGLPEKLIKFNLKDLQNSKDSIDIRIWQTHTIFTLNYDKSLSSNYKIHTNNNNNNNNNNKPIISTTSISESLTRNILDSILDSKLMEIKDDSYRGIDGSFTFIEISTKNKYKIVSFWSPMNKRNNDCKTVEGNLSMISKTINSEKLINEFKNSLEPGGYRWGMTSIPIDKFLDTDSVKTDFYIMAEEKIKTTLNITNKTNRWEYPLTLINNKPAKIADLNQYSMKDIETFELVNPNNPATTAIYGSRGKNGLIKIETK